MENHQPNEAEMIVEDSQQPIALIEVKDITNLFLNLKK